MAERDGGLAAVGLMEREHVPQDEQVVQQKQQEKHPELTWASEPLAADEEANRGGVVSLGDHENGVFLMVESNLVKHAPLANSMAVALSEVLNESEAKEPVSKSREAMAYANHLLSQQGESPTGRNGDRQQVAITLAHVSTDADGKKHLHTASIGGGKAVKYPDSDTSRKRPVDLNHNSEPSTYLDGTSGALEQVEYSSTEIEPNDRFVLASSAVVKNYVDKGLDSAKHKKAAKEGEPRDAALRLLGTKRAHRDKEVLVIDFYKIDEDGKVQHETAGTSKEQEEASKRSRIAGWFSKTKERIAERWAKMRGREKNVGRHALQGAGVTGGVIRVKDILDRNPDVRDNRPQYARVTHSASKRKNADRANGVVSRTEKRRLQREQNYIQKHSGLSEADVAERLRNRRVVRRTAIAIGVLAAYPALSHLFNYGIGDEAEMAATGKAQGLDLIPLLDRDGIDVDPTNTWPQWMNDELVGSTRDRDPVTAPPQTPAPRGTGPGWETATWQPRVFNEGQVFSGAGVEHLLHEPFGHNVAGYENFDGVDAHNLAEYLQTKHGENWLVFADDGSDATYLMQDGNVGISAPHRPVRFASEAIERDAVAWAQNLRPVAA